MKAVSVEIGHSCYSRCLSCNTYNQKNTKPSFEIIISRIDKLLDHGFTKIRLTGLEPTTHPQFIDIVKYLKENGATSRVTTTLTYPDDVISKTLNDVDILRVSIHGVYNHYRIFHGSNNFDRLLKNLKSVNTLTYYYTLIKLENLRNYTEVFATNLIKFYKEYPHPFEFFQMHGTEIMETDAFFQILHDFDIPFTYTPNVSVKRSTCTVMSEKLYVKDNGDVYPCCMAGGEVGNSLERQVLLGNIDTETLRKMCSKKLTGLDNPICDNCTPKYSRLM